jgi:hypothetical protein
MARSLRLVALSLVLLAPAAAGCDRAPARKVLGGIDGEAYCKSKGHAKVYWRQKPGEFDGRKTWGCEAADGSWAPFSFGVACTQQYRTTAHAEQEREDDPISWICVEGGGPSTPPASWNRANL